MASGKSTVYWDYIKIEEILALQTGIADSDVDLANDEVMFIVIHQIDELWFKLALRELVHVRDLFGQGKVREQQLANGVRGIRRMALLFEQIAHHFSLMETMTTRDYLGFRDKLSPASGFQSAQLREIEILLGLKIEERLPLGADHDYLRALKYPDGRESPASRRVAARLDDRPTLHEAIGEWLYRTPIQGSTPEQAEDEEQVQSFIEAYLAAQAIELESARDLAVAAAPGDADRQRLEARYGQEKINARAFLTAEDAEPAQRRRWSRIRAALLFIESYRELPLLAWPREVLDGLVHLEQAFVIFRQRHARMVERVVGRRTGTGGSAGVDYLDQTALKYRVFRDLWAVRTLLIQRSALPPLERPEVYNFVASDAE